MMINKATLDRMTRAEKIELRLKLIAERADVSRQMDQIILSGGRVFLNDPLSIRESRLTSSIRKINTSF